MRYVHGKFFFDRNNDIKCVSYHSNDDYYNFIRKCRKDGLHQIIITSEMMIDVIRSAYEIDENKVFKIELMVDDSDVENELSTLLMNIDKKPSLFDRFMDCLKAIAEKSSIEIKRVYIKGSYKQNNKDNFFIQSNGIVGINQESYEAVSLKLCALIKRCMNE